MLLGPHSESRAPHTCGDRESRRCRQLQKLLGQALRRGLSSKGRRRLKRCPPVKRERRVSISESIALLYGRGQLTLRMPVHAEVTLIEKGRLKKIADPAAAVRQAVSEPINSPSLAELARG